MYVGEGRHPCLRTPLPPWVHSASIPADGDGEMYVFNCKTLFIIQFSIFNIHKNSSIENAINTICIGGNGGRLYGTVEDACPYNEEECIRHP